MMRILTAMWIGCCLVAGLTGCSGGSEEKGGHAHHAAPHGGKLVEVGEHAYQLELVHDKEAGSLTVYVMDGHAENPVRIAQAKIEIELRAGGGEPQPVVLEAQANAASGERPGDSSVFMGTGESLKKPGILLLSIRKITLGGTDFTNLPGNIGQK